MVFRKVFWTQLLIWSLVLIPTANTVGRGGHLGPKAHGFEPPEYTEYYDPEVYDQGGVSDEDFEAMTRKWYFDEEDYSVQDWESYSWEAEVGSDFGHLEDDYGVYADDLDLFSPGLEQTSRLAKELEKLNKAKAEAEEALTPVRAPVADSPKPQTAKVASALKNLAEDAKESDASVDGNSGYLADLMGELELALNSLATYVGSLWSEMVVACKGYLQVALELVEGFWNALSGMMESLKGRVSNMLAGSFDFVDSVSLALMDFEFGSLFGGLKVRISKTLECSFDAIGGLFQSGIFCLNDFVACASEVVKAVCESLIGILDSDVWSVVSSGLQSVWVEGKQIVTGYLSSLGVFDLSSELVYSMVSDVKDSVLDSELVQILRQEIVEPFGLVFSGIQSDYIHPLVQSLPRIQLNFLSSLMKNLVVSVRRFLIKVNQAHDKLVKLVGHCLLKLFEFVRQCGSNQECLLSTLDSFLKDKLLFCKLIWFLVYSILGFWFLYLSYLSNKASLLFCISLVRASFKILCSLFRRILSLGKAILKRKPKLVEMGTYCGFDANRVSISEERYYALVDASERKVDQLKLIMRLESELQELQKSNMEGFLELYQKRGQLSEMMPPRPPQAEIVFNEDFSDT